MRTQTGCVKMASRRYSILYWKVHCSQYSHYNDGYTSNFDAGEGAIFQSMTGARKWDSDWWRVPSTGQRLIAASRLSLSLIPNSQRESREPLIFAASNLPRVTSNYAVSRNEIRVKVEIVCHAGPFHSPSVYEYLRRADGQADRAEIFVARRFEEKWRMFRPRSITP